jgi:HK97 family phage major capsid protein/HK97 family phage prohead protease
MIPETLVLKGEVSIDDAGTVTGIAWPFGSPDSVGDVIRPGAINLVNTLPMVMEHDQKQVVGVWETAVETDKGLEVKGRLFVEGIEPARNAHRQLKAGRMAGLSISFQPHDFEPRADGGRDFKSLTVTEISLCRRPVHPGARVTIVKSKEIPMEEEIENAHEAKADPVVSSAEFKALKASVDELVVKSRRPRGANDNHPSADNDNEMKAFTSFLRTGDATELKAVATDNDPAGGYFIIPTVDTKIRELLKDLSPMRGLAEVQPITNGSYERFYSMGKRGAQWVTERGDRPQDTAQPELIKHTYGVAEMYAAPATTRQMLDDASMDVMSWLINNAVHDFAETEGEAFLSGDGADNSPKGLLIYPTASAKDFVRPWGTFQFVPAGHASAPTDKQLSDALIRLVATLRKPYKGKAVFLMNSNTAIRLRQIVDNNNRYLWAPTGNLIEGVEHPLLGYRVEIDEGMPDIGENTHPIAFGDFKQGYVIVDRGGIAPEMDTVTQKGRVIFDVYRRIGGGAGDFNAIKFLKIAA